MVVSVAHEEADLLDEITLLAKENRFDYLVIESTGISEPLPVAETFTFADEDGMSLSDVATLDTMVTVVDAVNFLKDFNEAKYLQDTGESLGEDDERSVADLLVDQVEFADVILISKTDLVDQDTIQRLEAVIKTLNTHAKIIPISHGNIEINEVLNTGLFDFERAQTHQVGSKKCVESTCRRRRNMELEVSHIRPEYLFIQRSFTMFYTVWTSMVS